MGQPHPSQVRSGPIYAILAYGLWGIVPIYFKALSISAKEIVAHRVLWSAVFLGLMLTILRRWPAAFAAVKSRKTMIMLFISAYLVASNWYIYVYSAMSGHLAQASLGYFILPLVNVLAGILFFGDRLRRMQIIALTIAAAGVVYLSVREGELPWIGLTLAVTFAVYGIVRKVVPVDSVVGLTIETVLLAPTAIILLVIWEQSGGLSFGHVDRRLDGLIALSGVVTTIPLICFALAVRRVSLVTIGVLQYISPTLQLILAVVWYGEDFHLDRQISFGLIWAGLAVYIADAIRTAVRRHMTEPSEEPVPEPIDGGVPLTESQMVAINRSTRPAAKASR